MELPDEEKVDFILNYDRSDEFSRKVIFIEAERPGSIGSSSDSSGGDIEPNDQAMEGGSLGSGGMKLSDNLETK